MALARRRAVAPTRARRLIDESGHIFDLNSIVEIFTRDILRGRELSGVLLIAVIVGVWYHLFINRSRFGFDLRASGLNPFAARAGGVPPKRMIMIAMLLSGAVAGLVGMVDILSRNHRYDQNFTPGLGFAGIAVALLGRNNPVGMAVGAMLFAFLDASSSILQITGSASREIITIMQGVILLVVGDRLRVRATASVSEKRCEWPRWRWRGSQRERPARAHGPAIATDPAPSLMARFNALPAWLRYAIFAAIGIFVLAAVESFESGDAGRLTSVPAASGDAALERADPARRPRWAVLRTRRRRQHRARGHDDPRHLVRRVGRARVGAVGGHPDRPARAARWAACCTPSPR